MERSSRCLALAAALLVIPGLIFVAGPAPAAELCFVPDSQGRNYSVECGGNPATYTHDWAGYNTEAPPCNSFGIPGMNPCSIVTGAESRGGNGWYGWTLSSSLTDPFVNHGPIAGIPGFLYLHLACVDIGGLQAAAFEITGDIFVYSFVPMNGFLNAGDSSNILLATACVSSYPTVAGVFAVEWATPVEEAAEASSWGGVKSRYR